MIHRMRSNQRAVTIAVLILLGFCGLLPLDATSQFLLATAMAWAVAAVGLDMFSGYLGQPSFGHAGFIGLGAYGYAILAKYLPPLPAAVAALLAATAISVVIGSALVRLRDFGLVLGTFFFSYVVTAVLSGTTFASITNAESGLQVPAIQVGGTYLGQGSAYYWLCLLMLTAAVLLSCNYASSRAGRALRLVKRSETVAEALGAAPGRVKLTAFTYSASLAAVAGVLIAVGSGYLAPEDFTAQQSIILYAMVAVGGMGSIAGPILGAVLFTITPNYLQAAKTYQDIVFAVVLVTCLVLFRRGCYGLIDSAARAVARRARIAAPGTPPRRPAAVPDRLGSPGRSGVAAALDVEELEVAYDGVRALDGVTLHVDPGRVHAVVGPNGAGKTTLLNCVTGLEAPDHGAILVGNRPVLARGPARGRQLGVSRTFQNPALSGDLSCVENVMLGHYFAHRSLLLSDLLGLGRRREAASRAAAASILQFVGVGADRHDADADRLSFAEMKLVDIGRALAMDGRLLVMDEPTAGLSRTEMAGISALIRRLRETLTVVVVSHHVAWVREVAESATVLAAGRVLASGTPQEVFASADVQEVFIGGPGHSHGMEPSW
jgi:branched-chain amino acid transport system permease protein